MKTNISLDRLGNLGYLAAIGLTAAINDIDRTATTTIRQQSIYLTTSRTQDEIVDYLAHEYAPPGIIAPWNSANGLWAKDNQSSESLTAIIATDDARARKIRQAHDICVSIISELGVSRGSQRPAREQLLTIQELIAAEYPETDIGRYARVVAAGGYAAGRNGANGRYSYSGGLINLAYRLLYPGKSDEPREWASNVLHPGGRLAYSVSYSGWCLQDRGATTKLHDAKAGNPLIYMLAMQGLIETEYAVRYASKAYSVAPIWRRPMNIAGLRDLMTAQSDWDILGTFIGLGREEVPISIYQQPASQYYVCKYEHGFVGRQGVNHRPLGYIVGRPKPRRVRINLWETMHPSRDIYTHHLITSTTSSNNIWQLDRSFRVGSLIMSRSRDRHRTYYDFWVVGKSGLRSVSRCTRNYISDYSASYRDATATVRQQIYDIARRNGLDHLLKEESKHK